MSTTDPRSAMVHPVTRADPPAGPDSLSGQVLADTHSCFAAEGQDSPQATVGSAPNVGSPAGIQDTLGGQGGGGTPGRTAAEGMTSPQAILEAAPTVRAPAGSNAALPAMHVSVPTVPAPEGCETSRSQLANETQVSFAAAEDFPGGQCGSDVQSTFAAGEQAPATAIHGPMSSELTPWPDELSRDLAAAADTLDDIERLRIASENRLRQFTRSVSETDADGKQRGFGWDIRSPAVVAQATLVAAMRCDSAVIVPILGKAPKGKGCCLEHDAERNLTRALRAHPLAPWVREQKGIGEKQGARLIAVTGDPYMRPDLLLPDGSWEPARPRTVSELWAYCGLKGVVSAPEPGRAAAPVHLVQLWLCDPCLNGAGGECHTPGCALWINRAPDRSLRNSPFVKVIEPGREADPLPLDALLADRHQLREALRRIALGLDKDPSVAADRALTASREYRGQWECLEQQPASASDTRAAAQAAAPNLAALHAQAQRQRDTALERIAELEALTAERDYLRERFLWYENDRDKWREAAGSVTAERDRLRARHEEAEEHVAEYRAAASIAQDDRDAARARIAELEAQLAVARAAFEDLTSQLGEAREVCAEFRSQLETAVRENDDLTDELAGLRDHIDSLARGLDMSARTTAPSKKSEIERGCADALFGLLRVDGESIADTRKRLGVPQ